jgi:hypothetical protein
VGAEAAAAAWVASAPCVSTSLFIARTGWPAVGYDDVAECALALAVAEA